MVSFEGRCSVGSSKKGFRFFNNNKVVKNWKWHKTKNSGGIINAKFCNSGKM
jgi:hypothetical protein